MKSKTTIKALRSFVVIFALVFSTNTYAYSGFFGWFFDWGKPHNPPKWHGHKGDKPGRPADSVPLDGGLGILLLGAAAFGVKKLRDNNNEEA